jgi:hypothetical protein
MMNHVNRLAPSADNPFAPVKFKMMPSGRIAAMLGAWMVGEINADPDTRELFSYAVRLTDVPSVPRKPVRLDVAQAKIVDAVRQWIDGSEIADWLRSQEIVRASCYQGDPR